MKIESIILKPGQTLQAKLEVAGTLEVTAHFADKGSGGVTPSNQLTSITGTDAVDVVDAPPSGAIRMIKTVTLFNNASGGVRDVTLQINEGGTIFTLDYRSVADNGGFTTHDD